MSKLLEGIRNKKKFTIFMLIFLMFFMMSSIVTYKSYVCPLATNDNVIHSAKLDTEKEKDWIRRKSYTPNVNQCNSLFNGSGCASA